MDGNRRGRGTGRLEGDHRGAEAFVVSPFNRLARAHGFTIAGDTLVTIALADSLFFSIDPNDARWRVALYLLLTMAPFAVVAPWLGPLMDRLRGGHRAMVIATTVGRAVAALLIARHLDGLLLFPLAFSLLVLGKTYTIARSALVPSMVGDEAALVGANSRLSLLSAVSGAIAAVPGGLLLWLGGSSWVLVLTAAVFLAAAALATRIPKVRVAEERADLEERTELRQAGILLAATGMGYLRGVVGFLAMLLAFDLRGGIDPGPTGAGVELGHRLRQAMGLARLDLSTGGSPGWHFGVVLVGVGAGGFAGAAIAPRLRAAVKEEVMLVGVLAGTAALAVLAAIAGGLVGSFTAALAVSTAAATGKQAFDAIVQRDAPEANLGRSFARFETRFQLIWVVGALIPVVLPIPARLGFFGVAVTAAFAAFTVHFGRSPLNRLLQRFQPHLDPVRRRARRRVVRRLRRVRTRAPWLVPPRMRRARPATGARAPAGRDRDPRAPGVADEGGAAAPASPSSTRSPAEAGPPTGPPVAEPGPAPWGTTGQPPEEPGAAPSCEQGDPTVIQPQLPLGLDPVSADETVVLDRTDRFDRRSR